MVELETVCWPASRLGDAMASLASRTGLAHNLET